MIRDILFALIPMLLIILMFVGTIWSIVDLMSRERNDKTPWVLVIILLFPIGALIYLALGRK